MGGLSIGGIGGGGGGGGLANQIDGGGTGAVVEGDVTNNVASGNYSHAEGGDGTAGNKTFATNTAAHAEGRSTIASGVYSHAEGRGTTASQDSAHAEGVNTEASGLYSHAQGHSSRAQASFSHAGGEGSYAGANHSFSHGRECHAIGLESFAICGRAKAFLPGQFAHAGFGGSNLTNAGRQQNTRTVLQTQNLSGSRELYAGTGTTRWSSLGTVVAGEHASRIEIHAVAYSTTGADKVASWKISALIFEGAIVSSTGTGAPEFNGAGAAAWTLNIAMVANELTLTVDTSTDTARATATIDSTEIRIG